MFEAPIDAHVLIGDHAIHIVTPSSNRVVDSEAIMVQLTVFPRTSPTALVSGTGLQLRLALPIQSGTPVYRGWNHRHIGRTTLNIENTRWWDLLHHLPLLKNLYFL